MTGEHSSACPRVDIRTFGYAAFETTRIDAWPAFAGDLLGLMCDDAGAEGLYLRLDDHAARIMVRPGTVDRLTATGWELPDQRALDAAAAVLDREGVVYEWASAIDAHARRVENLLRLVDPAGNHLELFHSPLFPQEPVRLPAGFRGFVTGDMGLGHVVLPAGDVAVTFEFYTRVLGFLHRDSMLVAPPGVEPYRMRFLACNPRHHSLALTEATAPTGLRHLMLHVADVIDVGRAFDRCSAAGVLKTSIGQHSNDLMLSFYVTGPGGFEFEIASLGERHDNSTWRARELQAWKAWGYEPPHIGPR